MNTAKDLNYRLFLHREEGFRRTAFQTEFERYSSIQSGDLAQVARNFQASKQDFLAGKGVLSADPLTNVRYHVIIATAMIARICVEGRLDHDAAYTLSDIYIQRADVCKTEAELIDLLGEMQMDFARHMKELQHTASTSIHVRKCIDYIYEHLNEKLTLADLSAVVGLNGSYLSKLFVKETGGSLKTFILKAKISTAENMLRYSELSSLKISLALGFSSQSAFVATFHRLNGVTPREYKKLHYQNGLF